MDAPAQLSPRQRANQEVNSDPFKSVRPFILFRRLFTEAFGTFLAQLVGAFSASAMLLAVFGDVAHLGATVPTGAPWRAFVVELVITSALVIISLGTATRHRVLGPQAAIAVGGTIAACALVARPISGASMNPARSLAPAVLSHTTASLWVYLLAPFAAAAVGSAVLKIVHHRHHSEEREAAGGERK